MGRGVSLEVGFEALKTHTSLSFPLCLLSVDQDVKFSIISPVTAMTVCFPPCFS